MTSKSPAAVADVGLIGLAVMGQNLALNLADHGYRVAVFNRTTQTTDQFMARAQAREPAAGNLRGCRSLKELVRSLVRPRKILVLVKAGTAVDAILDQLAASGVEGRDIVVDCGNSHFPDTIRRGQQWRRRLRFMGSGVSGGEVGARFGPSLMPGGDPEAWAQIKPIWEAISAKVHARTGEPLEDYAPGKPTRSGVPCTAWMGPDGAGHYVKMVHNGIEYIDMQLIAEAYHLMRDGLGLAPGRISDIFAGWNRGPLASFLIQITAEVLAQPDPADPRRPLVEMILDAAGQKGTGKWTSASALDLGVPANTIAEAVFARCLSALKEERVAAARQLRGPRPRFPGKGAAVVEAIRSALHCSKICAYAQGFQLMAEAGKEYGWKFDYGAIASIWRGGCIIRAGLLQKIAQAYRRSPNLKNLMLDRYFRSQLSRGQGPWRKVVALAAQHGLPAPAFMASLGYYDGYRCPRGPANLIQAQRDYFGAHTYERTDARRGKFFHLDWPHPKRPQLQV